MQLTTHRDQRDCRGDSVDNQAAYHAAPAVKPAGSRPRITGLRRGAAITRSYRRPWFQGAGVADFPDLA
jgi:hypothetical protein